MVSSKAVSSAPPVIIYRLGSLGDTLVALPCFHKIAERFADRRRLVLTNFPVSSKAAPLEVILGGSGLIDGAIEYPLGLRSLASLWALRRRLRATESTTLVYLAASRGRLNAWRDWLFFRSCGFRQVLAIPLTADLLNNRIGADGQEEPEAERLARTLAGEFGTINLTSAASWDLRLTADERAAAAAALAPLGGEPFFAVNMGGKAAAKDWGEGNWHALMARLAGEIPTLRLVTVGAAEDSPRAAALLAQWPTGGVDICGRLNPRECAAALAGASFFIGHDSGPLHLAAAVQTPCVGLFGNYNRPRKWHPYGATHHILHDMRGVQAIGVDRVHSAVTAMAASSGRATR